MKDRTSSREASTTRMALHLIGIIPTTVPQASTYLSVPPKYGRIARRAAPANQYSSMALPPLPIWTLIVTGTSRTTEMGDVDPRVTRNLRWHSPTKSRYSGGAISDVNANFIPYVVFRNDDTSPALDPRKYGVEELSVMAVVCGDNADKLVCQSLIR